VIISLLHKADLPFERAKMAIDQLIGLRDIVRIGRDREIVEKHLRALLGNRIADLDVALGLGGAAA
jgi:hypothetical protein